MDGLVRAGTFQTPARLKEAGLDGVELGMLAAATFPSEAVRKELEKVGLECTSCSIFPKGLSLISEDRDIRSKAYSHVEDCLKATADAGEAFFVAPFILLSDILPGTGVRPMSGAEQWTCGRR